jgi:hypothetical protein
VTLLVSLKIRYPQRITILRGNQSTVKTENLVFDESSEGKVVEKVGEVFPHVGIAISSTVVTTQLRQ